MKDYLTYRMAAWEVPLGCMALLTEAKVNIADIQVETEKGDVILSGFVDTAAPISESFKVTNRVERVKK
jgi:osmotically-inducible protein OsmY